MKPKLYLETTIPSYLTARPSRDLIRTAHRQITQEWWRTRRSDFDLFVSQAVLVEVLAGDPAAAAERSRVLEGIPSLKLSEAAVALAETLMKRVPLPPKAAVDSLHVAIAVVGGMDYLLTWNCTHLANATLRGKFESIARSSGYEPPVICTPEELMEG